jgi:hypothetical protein
MHWILPKPLDIALSAVLFPRKVADGTNPEYYATYGAGENLPASYVVPITAAAAVGAYFILRAAK